jgi:3',5'-cyclic AMP phosphodiesterase CpdA
MTAIGGASPPAGGADRDAVRIVQVSDTHVSRKRAYFVDNWDLFVEEMRRHPPHLIVHSGDVSFDGADEEDDLEFARAEKDRLPAPWVAIPGNHDIGESPLAIRLQQPINAERMVRWRRHFGPSRWCHDLGAWRLIGVDTALLGSGSAEEEAQNQFLETSLRERADRPVMLFQHLPPFEEDPEDNRFTAAAVPHAPRTRLLETCTRHEVAVIACGHLHVYRQMEYRGMQIVWAPATSFFNIVEKQRRGLRVPRAGYLEWTLDGRSVAHRLVEPPLMMTHDVGAWNAAKGSTTKMPPRPLVRR